MAEITANLTEDQKIEIQQKTEALKNVKIQRMILSYFLKLVWKMLADLHIVQGQLREIICNGLDTPLNLYHAGTNGIYYQQVLIQIPDEIVQSPYFNLLSILMGEVGAGEHDYLEFQQIQTAVSGGLGMGASLRSKVDDKDRISAWLTLTTKSLTQKLDLFSC